MNVQLGSFRKMKKPFFLKTNKKNINERFEIV